MLAMGWLRDHRRYGAWPGLAALALQLVLSLGHIHIGNVHVDGVWRSAHAATAKSQLVALGQSPQKSPAQHSGQKSGDDEDYCAVCASIFLASTSLSAQPPQLPVPVDFERIAPLFALKRSLSASHSVFFQSRAPPLA